jgi:hypothetical protein
MKTTYLLIVLCVLSCNHLLGRIKNGYEVQLQSSRASLQTLYSLLKDNGTSLAKRLKIKSEIENMVSYISHYELTEELIRQLKVVSPEIYNDIDNVRDRKGRPTDVYIKVIPKDKSRINFKAASFFEQSPTDKDASYSEYGEYSVSVDIWAVDNALFLMSHELGHVKYIVPNLDTYAEYYKKRYAKSKLVGGFMGHSWNDQSGKLAHIFEKRFREDEKIYLESGGEKLESPNSLLNRFRKNTRSLEVQTPTIASKLAL